MMLWGALTGGRVCHVRVTVLVCEHVYLFGNSFHLLNLHTHPAQGPPRPRRRPPRTSTPTAPQVRSHYYWQSVSQSVSQSIFASSL